MPAKTLPPGRSAIEVGNKHGSLCRSPLQQLVNARRLTWATTCLLLQFGSSYGPCESTSPFLFIFNSLCLRDGYENHCLRQLRGVVLGAGVQAIEEGVCCCCCFVWGAGGVSLVMNLHVPTEVALH